MENIIWGMEVAVGFTIKSIIVFCVMGAIYLLSLLPGYLRERKRRKLREKTREKLAREASEERHYRY